MPETGNNFSTKNMVSIQISLNGLSFYDTKANKVWQSSTISIDETFDSQLKKLRKISNSAQIIISTDNFVMIPTDLFLPQDRELYFTAKLLPYSTEQFQYIETTVGGVIFITALEATLADLFSNTFTTTTYTHPLLQTVQASSKIATQNSIHIYQTDERCAISITSGSKLQFSDYLKIASELDIAYFLKKLISDNNHQSSTIHSHGINRKQIAESLAPYFNKITYSK